MSKKKAKKNNKSVEIEQDFEELENEIDELEDEEVELDEDFEEFEEEDTEVTIMDMLNRIVVCLIIIAIILAINTIVLVCKDGKVSNKDSNSGISTVENDFSTDDYDVSKMTAVDVKGAVDLFTSKKTYILYIGRSTCSACKTYVPRLNEMAEKYGATVQYLDINTVTKDNEYYDTLVKKMNVETAVNTDNGEQKGTYGEFLGYTPMTVIIQNGKQVDGAIGAVSATTLEKLFQDYEIGTKK